ncbi:peptidoglycan-binding protein [Bacillus sp. CLL-7-23]|uniref:Peptidoglycan-binding protein n=1 Tax=Bacillus changyiensis TaxID=3004103 RepID=A0ABT4XAU2_9BACI|nr:peptidoglycan-binding protein [Bacillus changyiensis]MDA7028551.1 peptidoglycan-binding protein [Bacillus changyiensis]
MKDYNLCLRQKTGKLMVFVFEGNKAKPINGATVTITGNNQNITLETNASGQTKSVELPAQEPYSSYTVNVTANGYSSIKVDGVQVFPNTSGIQEIPMAIQRGGNYRQHYSIPEHKLTQPEPIKPPIDPLAIPDPQPQPVSRPDSSPIGLLIPEYIIVHCGAPKDYSATKYLVKFTDYITKVACGEIFSSWHSEALKANILCIISYTLNKIFTQYYEGKFDITCLIQFDHKFDPLQTTFKEIIEVVDTIFNQYIKHPDPNKIQPFLAEYRAYPTSCRLGQYKSQELAKQGYKHLDILKYFYEKQGCYSSIKIAHSPGVIFQGRPTPPPEQILKEKTSGSDVREIQVYLNEIAKQYTQIPKMTVDGKFGSATKNAVKEFQRIFIIPETGVVDLRTWYKMANLYYSILKYKKLNGLT